MPAFARSADFAVDKPAGRPCLNLADDFRCGIHHQLRDRGFPGCTVYDCFGAGQHLAQGTFDGRDWREHPELADAMFAAFPVMRDLHELLWYLDAALARAETHDSHGDLEQARRETERLTESDPDILRDTDTSAHQQKVNRLLVRASEAVRKNGTQPSRDADPRSGNRGGANLRGADPRSTNHKGADHKGADHKGADHKGADHKGADHKGASHSGASHSGASHSGASHSGASHKGANRSGANLRGADLMGRDLRNANLTAANLRGAYLIGADLTNADLTDADVIGADFRSADVTKADLEKALFLTQFQVNAARGDAATTLPETLTRPPHWA